MEVRTRAYMFQGQTPEQSVNKDKQRHLCRAANAYVKMHRITKRVTLDVIGLIIDPRTKEVTYINHIQDAFNAPLRTVVPTRTFGGPRISLKKKKRHGF